MGTLEGKGALVGETFEDDVARTALKRIGQPEDIARVVACLAGPTAGGSAARTCPPPAACCPRHPRLDR